MEMIEYLNLIERFRTTTGAIRYVAGSRKGAVSLCSWRSVDVDQFAVAITVGWDTSHGEFQSNIAIPKRYRGTSE